MITVVREMAHRVATELAHMERPRLDAGCHRRGAERGAGRGARAGTRGGAGVGRARSRAAADPARARRRGCRRLRRHAADRGSDRRPAGRRTTRSRRSRTTPSRSKLHGPEHESSVYRYCTNFVVTGGGLAPAGLVLRCWRSIGDSVLVVGDASDAARPRPHRRPGAGGGGVRAAPERWSASTWRTCTSRRSSARRASPWGRLGPRPFPSCAAGWSRSRPARACAASTSSSART